MALFSEAMATPSYERQSISAGLPEVARADSALEWQEWLNAGDWQRQAGFDLSSSGSSGTLGVGGGAAAATAAAAAAGFGAMSLSQQQLHTQSTAREFGPRALGLFSQAPGSRSSQRASNGRRSASPTLMRVGFRGRMQQRATSVHSAPKLAKMNQGEWGAAMMQQSTSGVPQATWRGNRRRQASADGRAPALVPLGQRSRPASPVAQLRARGQEELQQRRLQRQQKRQARKRQQPQQSFRPDTQLEAGSGRDQFSPPSTRSSSRAAKVPRPDLRMPATSATVSTSPPRDNSARHGSRPQSAADFDDGYARKMALKSECALLVKEGDRLIKQYASCLPLST
eukprot:COSAG02_NODE_3963_length_5980_cov_16.337528_10_plen_341_part_00